MTTPAPVPARLGDDERCRGIRGGWGIPDTQRCLLSRGHEAQGTTCLFPSVPVSPKAQRMAELTAELDRLRAAETRVRELADNLQGQGWRPLAAEIRRVLDGA